MPWTVLDLFSGGGGMSYGFHANPNFVIIGAVDAQHGKPSNGKGSLECNKTYEANMGISPIEADLSSIEPTEVYNMVEDRLQNLPLSVLISCAPCTGFSRIRNKNHLVDDPRNSLVARSALFVERFRPRVFVMENARELLMGRFSHHFESLRNSLVELGYNVHASIHFLNKFGLPQKRERALIIAVSGDLEVHSLEELWEGYTVKEEATYVRRAIGRLSPIKAGETDNNDPMHFSPKFSTKSTIRRLELMNRDGMSWADLKDHPEAEIVLTPAMKRYVANGEFGSHPDVYGRLWWDRPAVTIKRECGHVGNGRYSHPTQNRLCSVREMGILQGFPSNYKFVSSAFTNMYRHIGDAVPPLISFQISKVCQWILSGEKPQITECILPNTNLTEEDIVRQNQQPLF